MWMPWYECLFANSRGASNSERFDAAGNVSVCEKHGIAPTSTNTTMNTIAVANPPGIIVLISMSYPK
jgi:hypothetical protein